MNTDILKRGKLTKRNLETHLNLLLLVLYILNSVKQIKNALMQVLIKVFQSMFTSTVNQCSTEGHYFFIIKPFPKCSHNLMHLHQIYSENIGAKGKIAHDEQFLLLPQIFQRYSIILLLHYNDFHILSYAVNLLYVGKG